MAVLGAVNILYGGWIALRRGDVAGASDLAAEAFRLDPTDVGALNVLASCALKSQLRPQAAELARLALDADRSGISA